MLFSSPPFNCAPDINSAPCSPRGLCWGFAKLHLNTNNHLQVIVIQILNINLMMNCVERKPTFSVSTKCINIFYEVDAISLSLSLSLYIYIYIYM
jgi:hypothetical protein